jgi:hypothetical protein
MFFILPTFEILQDFQESEQLFNFYNDGMKGVVRDLIVHWEGGGSISDSTHITEKILRDYSNSPEATISRFTDRIDMEAYVELITSLLDIAVGEMLNALFPKITYDISNNEHSWIGDDLIIKLRVI